MDKFEILNKYIDGVINKEDPAVLKELFKEYASLKSKELLYPEPINEFVGNDSPVKLKANEVFVNNKKVGALKTDANDMDSGINFTTIDGKYSKEFDSIQHLYRFLIKNFANKPTQNKEFVEEGVSSEKDCKDCKLTDDSTSDDSDVEAEMVIKTSDKSKVKKKTKKVAK